MSFTCSSVSLQEWRSEVASLWFRSNPLQQPTPCANYQLTSSRDNDTSLALSRQGLMSNTHKQARRLSEYPLEDTSADDSLVRIRDGVRPDPGVDGMKTTSQIALFYYVDDGFKGRRLSQLFQHTVALVLRCRGAERVALALARSRSMLVFWYDETRSSLPCLSRLLTSP
jgi:hypothetical protein